jgi:glycosyltransferase XagB
MIVILLASVLAPLGGPLGLILLGLTLAEGGPAWPSNEFDIGAATICTSVFVGGAAAVLGPILLGMKRRGLLFLWPSLFLLPAYYAIISFAAWTSLYDLMVRPYHWCKTEHGLTQTRRRRSKSAKADPPRRRAASLATTRPQLPH